VFEYAGCRYITILPTGVKQVGSLISGQSLYVYVYVSI